MNWQLDWQNVATLTVLGWAFWYVARRVIGILRRDPVTGCGTCHGCAGRADRDRTKQQPLVPVESLIRRNGR